MKKMTTLCLSLLALASVTGFAREAIRTGSGSAGRLRTEREFKGIHVPGLMKDRTSQGNIPGVKFRSPGVSKVPLAPAGAPRRSVSANTNLYGWLFYYNANPMDNVGICRISSDGSYQTISHDTKSLNTVAMGLKDDEFYTVSNVKFGDWIVESYINVYDAVSGELVEESALDLFNYPDLYFMSAAYDAKEFAFYGVSRDLSGVYNLLRYDIASKEFAKLASGVDFIGSLTINQMTDEIVGITSDSRLVTIDRVSGNITEKATVEIQTQYTSGLCYSPTDGGYIWNPNTDAWSKLVLVSENGNYEEICDMPEVPQFTALYCPDTSAADPESPSPATYIGSDFVGGSVSGTVTWHMPETLLSGDVISGEVDYTVSLDNVEHSAGKASAGSDVTVEFAALTDGNHTFSLTPGVAGHLGAPSKIILYVGNDTPLAPASVTLTETEVSWEPVTRGVHDGYVDAAAVTYTVRINDVVIAENVSGTSCPSNLPDDTPLASYVASVCATANGLTGAETTSNDIVYGQPLSMPVSLEPTEAQTRLFTVADANGDSRSWTAMMTETGYKFCYTYGARAADDWLFLPPVVFSDAETTYGFSMSVMAANQFYPERYEVKIGKAPEAAAMTSTIIEETIVSNTVAENVQQFFSIDEPGIYYVGVHCVSDADQYNLFVSNFNLEDMHISPAGPGKVTGVAASAAPMGELKATVTFVMPTLNLKGEPIASGSEIVATVTSDVESVEVKGLPGAEVSVDVATLQGDNRLKIQAAVGDDSGDIEYVNVYTGIDVPGAIEVINASESEDNMSATITWEAPLTGGNGGYIPATGMKYWLCEQSIWGWEIVEEIGVDVFSYVVSVPVGTPLADMQYGIVAQNEIGMSPSVTSVAVSLGEAYSTPAVETFPGNNLTYVPLTIFATLDPSMQWAADNPAALGEKYANESGSALICMSDGADSSLLRMPKFSTSGADKAAFSFTILEEGCTEVLVNARTYGAEKEVIFRLSDVNHGPGVWETFTIDLPAIYQNKPWVVFEIDITMGDKGGLFMLDSYKIRNMQTHDLEASAISGPLSGTLGQTLRYSASVSNEGRESSELTSMEWTVTDENGNLLHKESIENNHVIAPGNNVRSEMEFTPGADMLGRLTVKFAIADNDDDNTNNSSEVTVSIAKGDAVVVTDLEGKRIDGGIELTWSEPAANTGFQSFEDLTPFVVSGAAVGEFTNVDRDGDMVYSWQGAQNNAVLQGVAGRPGAFNVYNGPQLDEIFGQSGLYPAADGEQFLIAFCPTSKAADDWLISPLVAEGSAFSFSYAAITGEYGAETIEVMYSEGSDNPDDFRILDTIRTADVIWSRYEGVLPEGADRFAIHYVSDNIFGIMIDAIRYEPAAAEVTIVSYEVYRSEDNAGYSLIADVASAGYTDTNASLVKDNRYYVVPVMSDGARGLQSNVAFVKGDDTGVAVTGNGRVITAMRGGVIVRGYAGEEVSVSTTAGITVARATASDVYRVELPAGIYVVRAGNDAAKVTVK